MVKVKVNYYAELGLDPNLDTEALKKALLDERRKWVLRQGRGNLDVRQKAEKKVAMLDEFSKILNDKFEKETYDRNLKKQGSQWEPPRETVDYTDMAGDALVSLASRLYDVGDNNQALDVCKRALTVGVKNQKVYNILGSCYMELGQAENAFATFKSALDVFPGDSQFTIHIARICLFLLNRVSEAQSYVSSVLVDEPENPFALATQIAIHIYNKNERKAEAEIEKYLSANPSNQAFRESISEAYISYSDTFLSETSNGVKYVETQDNYDSLMRYREKAHELCPSKRTSEIKEQTLKMNKKQFNKYDGWGVFVTITITNLAISAFIMDINETLGMLFWLGLSVLVIYSQVKPLWVIERAALVGGRTPVQWIVHITNIAAIYYWKLQWHLLKGLFEMFVASSRR
jgi:tetratricopeptide (TPR) repeat protein